MSALYFLIAAVLEIGGCYAFWAWLKLGKSPLWLGVGAVSLVLFAIVLTRVEAEFAGRAYAAYGGVYIASSLLWLALIERTRPYWTDLVGAGMCLLGAALIFWGPKLFVSGQT